ncbi:(2Fe-2S)-binding protein [Sphingomonas sp.]|uniref:(2Fe-2S)-binding protein n=1 Tax=Sphingomonas sp. TaxID=28214 RepID=UPI001E13FEA7|nr:(2Fe-2S)-binding protein [Sphingomonas sp.]MBX9795821.1 (2Fe-2S)-binding protein [Sphingomonas sp.]
MIICICNNIRENELRSAVRDEHRSACQTYRSMGCRAKCGQCIRTARTIIAEARATA